MFILAGFAFRSVVVARGTDLISASAILSTILNPLAFKASDALQKIVRTRFPELWASYGRERSAALDGALLRIRELGEER